MYFKMLLCTVLFVIINVQFATSAKILGVFPSPSRSHQIVYKTLMEELSKRGHDLIVMTTDPADVKYKQIDVHNVSYETFYHFVNKSNMRFPNNDSPLKAIELACEMMLNVVDKQFQDPMMQEIIHDYNTTAFDLIFIEGIFPTASAFKKRFNCPIILISSLSLSPSILDEFGNTLHPTIYPDMLAPYDPKETTVLDRIYLLIRHFGYKIYYYMKYAPLFDSLTSKHFGEEINNVVIDSDNVADMIFLNYNPIWHGVRPLVPAIVPIGSIHIKEPNPLPQNLKNMLDNATEGVIYFSFGTNIKSGQLLESTRRIFTDAFREMPYTVLWKWEDSELPDKPDNVHISRWFPQLSILAHHNVRIFITQGGQQSVEESIHCNVPMLVLPLLFDQEVNGFRVENRGIGRTLVVRTLTKEIFKTAITEIIQNPGYVSNITQLRELMYDESQTSLSRAVWWTEYVIRHNGAAHLRSPAAQISIFKYLMIDLILSFVTYATITYCIIAFVRKRFAIRIIHKETGTVSDVLSYCLSIVLCNLLMFLIALIY